MTDLIKSWQELAQEASVENDPKRLIVLIHELNEALAREQPNKKINMNRQFAYHDNKTAQNPGSKPAVADLRRDLGNT